MAPRPRTGMTEDSNIDTADAQEIDETFAALKSRLVAISAHLRADPAYPHTSVIVPSLSVNQEELAKVTGAAFYEERLLFALIRLRNPNAQLIYITSQPVHPDIVDYYLHFLDGVSVSQARRRLKLFSVCDGSARALTEKILERPRLLERVRQCIVDRERAYLTCYNSTDLERRLAVELGIPLNGIDPMLLPHGTKSGNRKIFRAAGVAYPAGREDLESPQDIVEALVDLRRERPDLERAVVKINEGFGGEGNGIFTYPEGPVDADSVTAALEQLGFTSKQETLQSFLRKFAAMGGIVEELVAGHDVRSPSVQMRIYPDGTPKLVSSHEQVLGGTTGQSYLGCRFPANDDYRPLLLAEAQKIGTELSALGVTGRFGIDFLVCRNEADEWNAYAIEINLRMGGTTPPFHALEFLTGGELDPGNGLFVTPAGDPKYYCATDNLKSPAYRGLLPEDLFDIISRYGLGFSHRTGTGVLFYMIGALSQYGKLGMTAIGNSRQEAQAIFDKTVAMLDAQTEGSDHGVAMPLLDRYLTME